MWHNTCLIMGDTHKNFENLILASRDITRTNKYWFLFDQPLYMHTLAWFPLIRVAFIYLNKWMLRKARSIHLLHPTIAMSSNGWWLRYPCGLSRNTGTDNCKDVFPFADAGSDCCEEPGCRGYVGQGSCCTSSAPCEEGGGDCDSDT